MNQKPEVSDSDIREYMNFEGILKKRMVTLHMRHSLLKWGASFLLVSGIVGWVFLYSDKTPSAVDQKKIETPQAPSTVQASPPDSSIVQAPAVQPEKKSDRLPTAEEKEEPVSIVKQDTLVIEEDVYVPAEPADGYTVLYEYFASNLVYPPEAMKDSIQGTITVFFVINPEGKAEKIKMKQSLGEAFDREAKRLVENMPLWKPATLNGKDVASKVSLPLTFQIQK